MTLHSNIEKLLKRREQIFVLINGESNSGKTSLENYLRRTYGNELVFDTNRKCGRIYDLFCDRKDKITYDWMIHSPRFNLVFLSASEIVNLKNS